MTLILIVWFRKYDYNQDFDSDDENSINKTFKVFFNKAYYSMVLNFLNL